MCLSLLCVVPDVKWVERKEASKRTGSKFELWSAPPRESLANRAWLVLDSAAALIKIGAQKMWAKWAEVR